MSKNYLPLNLAKPLDRIVLNDQEDQYCFNPAFAQLNSTRFLLAYRIESKNMQSWDAKSSKINLVLLDENLKQIFHNIPPIINAEDPRILIHENKALIFYTQPEFSNNQQEISNHIGYIVLGLAHDTLQFLNVGQLEKDPFSIGFHCEKNWVPFNLEKNLSGFVYTHNPWRTITFQVTDSNEVIFNDLNQTPGCHWDYGEIRGGSSALPWNNNLISFFHSSIEVLGRRIYSIGAVIFEKEYPNKPLQITSTPLLTANSLNGRIKNTSILFSSSAQQETNGDFKIFLGVDDESMAQFIIQEQLLLERINMNL